MEQAVIAAKAHDPAKCGKNQIGLPRTLGLRKGVAPFSKVALNAVVFQRTQSPVWPPSPSPPRLTQSSGKPSIAPRQSRRRHCHATRFNRNPLKNRQKRQFGCRNFGLILDLKFPVRIGYHLIETFQRVSKPPFRKGTLWLELTTPITVPS